MPGKVIHIDKLQGLNEQEVLTRQQQYGRNIIQVEGQRRFQHIVSDIVREPMFLLLVVACTLYFVLGQPTEGFMMMAAMFFVAGISLYQDVRSSKALEALKMFTEPKTKVIRQGIEQFIALEELVPGDIILLEEGNQVPADAEIIQENDLSINESILTGESMSVEKHESPGQNLIFQGTTINSGKCYAIVSATGYNTALGKLGKSIHTYVAPKTLLQREVSRFVRRLALFGIVAFLTIWLINYLHHQTLIQSMLFGLTLAMAAIPEEIPVAFSSFMALGAFQMSKLGIISRQPQVIESLGAVSVICLDKTGTITENRMQVVSVYDLEKDLVAGVDMKGIRPEVLGYAMLASEQRPFDAMEIAIFESYNNNASVLRWERLKQVYEYPLEGRPPMMTHIYQQGNQKIAAAKGGIERIIQNSGLDETVKARINALVKQQASKGYRVIGVASAIVDEGQMPASQDEFRWKAEGFICLYDPPKENVREVMKKFDEAKLEVKLLTGDFPETALNIAGQVGMNRAEKYLSGEVVMGMNDEQLKQAVKDTDIFARMFPEAKLRVIGALQANGHIVAMTGDGVNDSPALQAADVGIAMGKKGTEMARQTADLILTDDNLDKVVEAIRQGRKIFINIKKAIRYIISIHIPIILTVSLPLLFGWKPANLFTPVHIIFLELIMGPTCSIFFEREPIDENAMSGPPRNRKAGLFAKGELLISIVQGLVITAGVMGIYYFSAQRGAAIEETRAMVFSTLVISNLFLTFTNRSFTENLVKTIRYKNNLAPWVWLLSVFFIVIIHTLGPVRDIFGFSPVSLGHIAVCTGVAFVSVFWFELYKTNA